MTEHPENRHNHGTRPLRRPQIGRMFAGVAAAVAARFGIDVTIVRVGFAALTILGGAGVPLYVAAWLLIPDEGTAVSIGQQWTRALASH
jgi:phage shock protein C